MKLIAAVVAILSLTAAQPANLPGTAPAPASVTAQPEETVIDQFLAMLDGTEAAATAAIKKFGSDEVIANGMIPFGKNPKIIATDGNCVRVSLQGDDAVNVYTLCEENGKITEFDWYFDDDED